MKTVSKKLAEQLKDAGFPQEESVFYFCTDMGERTYSKDCQPYDKATCGKHLALPFAEEILERLPGEVKMSDGQEYELYIYPSHGYRKGQWKITYKLRAEWVYFAEDSLVEAAGKMWLYLKENNLLTHSGISI